MLNLHLLHSNGEVLVDKFALLHKLTLGQRGHSKEAKREIWEDMIPKYALGNHEISQDYHKIFKIKYLEN